MLAPGLRLGFVVAPKAVYPKLLQAKQAADLHSPGFNQRMIAEVMKDGFLDRHVPTIRALYKAQRDAMLEALAQHFPHASSRPDQSLTWNTPAGGMFLWARLPVGMNAVDLLPLAVDKGWPLCPVRRFTPTMATRAPCAYRLSPPAWKKSTAVWRPWRGHWELMPPACLAKALPWPSHGSPG